ncbi:MAG: hypothetical protein DRO88_00775 [Promethearchaeia archaeon]|nr:MAG: hypothetical protein DRO88_00775 [Candidatus Lokiarchaeia archaeon]
MLILIIKSTRIMNSIFPVSKTCELKDNRILSYYEFGDPNGLPVLYFHGFPGSGAEGRFIHPFAQKEGFRVIAPSRSGMGKSTFYSPRKLVDWPQDVIQLADFLEIEEFSILGISGGAPYALVCGRYLPVERLKGIITISGVAPIDNDLHGIEPLFRIGLRLGRLSKKLMSFGLWMFLTRRYNTENKALKATIRDVRSFSEKDRFIFQNRENIEIYSRLMYEAFMHGTRPVTEDASIYLSPWGFNLSEINPKIPIEIWHGESDEILPYSMAIKLAGQIKHANLSLFADEGHLSTVFYNTSILVERIKQFFKEA